MQRLVVLGVVAACGGADGNLAASRPALSPVAATPGPDDRADTVVIEKLDTSIAHIWAAPPQMPEPPPPRAGRDDRSDRAALDDHDALYDSVPPVPRAREPGRRAPCFAHRDVLVGSEIWRDLREYAIGMSSDKPPSGRYGTCTIADGQLRDARNTVLAELHCGISVHAPGIIDHLGFEIGASGAAIAAAHENAAHAADATYVPPRVRAQPLDTRCRSDGPGAARCWLDDGSGQEPGSHYVFAATAKMPERGVLRGVDARRFFEAHTVSSFTVRITCH